MKKSNLKNINLKSLRMKGLSGGKRFGPPPLKGPNPIVPPVKFGLGGMMSSLVRQILGKNPNQESTNNTFRDFYVLNKEGQSEKLNVTPYKPMTMKKGGLKTKKASMGMMIGFGADSLLSNSQTARDLAGNLGLGGKMLSNYYNKKNQSEEDEKKRTEESSKSLALKNGGIGCPYRRGGKTDIQGVSKIQLKGKKFIGVK